MTDTDVPALELKQFGVSFGEHVVLAEITLSCRRVGASVILGAGGAGKSTLLRTLAGLNDQQPALKTWGKVFLDGELCSLEERRRDRDPVGGHSQRRLALVVQNARFLTSSIRESLLSSVPDRKSLSRTQQDEFLAELLRENGLSALRSNMGQNVLSLSTTVQRQLAILQAVLTEPLVLCVDEATAQLSEADAEPVLELLERQAQRRALIFVTHNQTHARRLGGRVALIAGGRVVTSESSREFFEGPQSEIAAIYTRTGSYTLPSPTATSEELADDQAAPPPLPPAAVAARKSRFLGPRGFFWLEDGKVGGCPRPGIVSQLNIDLEALARLGVSHLVTLEENMTVAPRDLDAHGLKGRHFPINDMGVAPEKETAELCSWIHDLVNAGSTVAVHCRAGLGRTGTILVCYLIWKGASPQEAFSLGRSINPKWVQSEEQVEFLTQFAKWLQIHGEDSAISNSSTRQPKALAAQ